MSLLPLVAQATPLRLELTLKNKQGASRRQVLSREAEGYRLNGQALPHELIYRNQPALMTLFKVVLVPIKSCAAGTYHLKIQSNTEREESGCLESQRASDLLSAMNKLTTL